ncbi:MAG: EfeM/EfeO family lipoprotein [Solirubrobacteraceae bacterium]|nr:EfeM/EfeO family lipoprotein [Patulibacter sp.]
MLQRLSRGTTLVAVFVVCVVVGLVAFTALGVGGRRSEGARITKVPHVEQVVYVPHTSPGGMVGRSESIGQREGGVTGNPDGAPLPENIPFTRAAFDAPIHRYRDYAASQVKKLRPEVATLAAAIRRGDRPAARAAWRAAFARYLRLGAVYGAFGQLDTDIEGLPGGLPKGEHDPHFIGLHRIEMGLWTGESVRSLTPVAARLQRDVQRLSRAVRVSSMQPLDYATRAHEILEDAQRDYLSGTSVTWSGEGVLATASGVSATALILGTLRPLLQGQQSQVTTEAGITRLDHTLAALRAAHGGHLPTLSELSLRERQRLVGSLGWALERLQAIPGSLETQDPATIPKLETKTP